MTKKIVTIIICYFLCAIFVVTGVLLLKTEHRREYLLILFFGIVPGALIFKTIAEIVPQKYKILKYVFKFFMWWCVGWFALLSLGLFLGGEEFSILLFSNL